MLHIYDKLKYFSSLFVATGCCTVAGAIYIGIDPFDKPESSLTWVR